MNTSTLTDVANLALAAIGEKIITNINAETTPAKEVRVVLSETLRQVQLLTDWVELRTPLKPSLYKQDEETGEYYYNLPTNFLSIVEAPDGWYLQGGKLVSSTPDIEIIYKRYSEEPTEWSGELTELTYRKLAYNVVTLLTQNDGMTQMTLQIYERNEGKLLSRYKNRNRDLQLNGGRYSLNRMRNTRRHY